jgi:hypothetical protein
MARRAAVGGVVDRDVPDRQVLAGRDLALQHAVVAVLAHACADCRRLAGAGLSFGQRVFHWLDDLAGFAAAIREAFSSV